MQKGYTINVLDKGFVRLVDNYGTDLRIVESARISYLSPSKGEEQDKKLISYLYKNLHTSVFEQVKITFHIKIPLFVFGQFVRHRCQNLNVVSRRYTEASDDFYIPDKWRKQDTKNKQGSVVEEDWDARFYVDGHTKNKEFSANFENACYAAFTEYQKMIEQGVSREMARMVLPQNLYTECYSTWDLNNLMKFFRLRLDEHAQWEIRQYAKAMFEIFEGLYPWTAEAYKRYKFVCIDTLTGEEV